MKITITILASLSALLLLSTIICGAWIQFSGKPVDKSSLNFHMLIALASTGITLITLILAAIRVWHLAT